MDILNYKKQIFQITTEDEFNNLSLELFEHQYKSNEVYAKYIELMGFNIKNITNYYQIPFLPIELFRTQKIISKQKKIKTIFFSSGTTNDKKGKHYIADLKIYKQSILNCFDLFFQDPKDYVFFCLIPNIKTSSLSFMASELIRVSNDRKSGFYLEKEKSLISNIKICQQEKRKFVVFGLSFEILKFAKKNNLNLNGGIVIQTGGTKKEKKIIIQEELHKELKSLFKIDSIYSEYGMAELLSQSYYKHNCFETPPWKKIIIRDKTNPIKIIDTNERGCINVIDLANIHSCAFVATNDLGHTTRSGFNIIGRAQNATAKGCSLMT